MYNHSVHHGIKHNCCFCSESFSTTQIFERQFNICLIVKFKNYTRKIKLSFTIYADAESILIPKNNGKQNPDTSYLNKHKNHVGCSYGYKLVCC